MPERLPHSVSGLPQAARPDSDTQRLTRYMTEEFSPGYARVRRLNRSVKAVRSQESILELMVQAIDLRMELDIWIPFAERLRDELLSVGYEIAADARADAQRSRAKAEAGALIEAVEQLRAVRDSLHHIGFAAQAQLKHLDTDEGLEAMREDAVGAINPAPVASHLRRQG